MSRQSAISCSRLEESIVEDASPLWRGRRKAGNSTPAAKKMGPDHYSTEPAVGPLTIERSRKISKIASCAMAGVARTVIDHKLMRCEPVWLFHLAWLIPATWTAANCAFVCRSAHANSRPGCLGAGSARAAPKVQLAVDSKMEPEPVGDNPGQIRILNRGSARFQKNMKTLIEALAQSLR